MTRKDEVRQAIRAACIVQEELEAGESRDLVLEISVEFSKQLRQKVRKDICDWFDSVALKILGEKEGVSC